MPQFRKQHQDQKGRVPGSARRLQPAGGGFHRASDTSAGRGAYAGTRCPARDSRRAASGDQIFEKRLDGRKLPRVPRRTRGRSRPASSFTGQIALRKSKISFVVTLRRNSTSRAGRRSSSDRCRSAFRMSTRTAGTSAGPDDISSMVLGDWPLMVSWYAKLPQDLRVSGSIIITLQTGAGTGKPAFGFVCLSIAHSILNATKFLFCCVCSFQLFARIYGTADSGRRLGCCRFSLPGCGIVPAAASLSNSESVRVGLSASSQASP